MSKGMEVRISKGRVNNRKKTQKSNPHWDSMGSKVRHGKDGPECHGKHFGLNPIKSHCILFFRILNE